MSESTARKCTVCGARAYGAKGNGRRNFGGTALRGTQIVVSGVLVNAGLTLPVCETHRDMVISARAMAVQGGHAARQEAELNILSADTAEQDIVAARRPRLAALVDAVWQTMTGDELEALTCSAETVAWKANRGSTALDIAMDDVRDAFAKRVAEETFRTVADSVDAIQAVNSVDRAAIMRGLGHVSLTRTGMTARVGSIDTDQSTRTGETLQGLSMGPNMDDAKSVFNNGDGVGYRLASGRIIGQAEFLALVATHSTDSGETGRLAREIMSS